MRWCLVRLNLPSDAGGSGGHPSNTQKFIDVVEACEHMRYWMVWSRGKCWKNSYTCWEKGRLCVSVFHYNIHLKSIDAYQTWKHDPFFGTIFLLKSPAVSMLFHVFSYLASECRVCLQPYSVAHSSSKEWYVATKESLHWCHNNGRPWRCNNRSWMSLGTEGWCDTQPFSQPFKLPGPGNFPQPLLINHIEMKWETSHFKVCEWLIRLVLRRGRLFWFWNHRQ